MSFLCTIMEFIQNMCSEDGEINNIFKDIDEISLENTRTNNQVEELDREHIRLQIELSNLETIIKQNNQAEMESATMAMKKIYENSMELERLINDIDFTKILQCHHMEMEAKCRKEWEPIYNQFVKNSQWHDRMAERHIVREFKQAEEKLKSAQETMRNQKETLAKSLQKCYAVLAKAGLKRNEIMVNIIRGVTVIENLKEKLKKLKKYEVDINGLRRERFNLAKQTQHKIFNPIITSNDMNITTLNSSQNLSAMNYILPKLPSFTDILNSFNERSSSQITVIENTTNVNVKSILHNSNDGSFKTNQSIMCKQTKHVHFKLELEEYLEDKNDEIETVLSPSSTKEMSAKQKDLVEQSSQNDIETVDLLTPSQKNIETVCDVPNTTDVTEQCKNTKKAAVEILECITFKAPQPIPPRQFSNNQTFDKENLSNTTTASGSKQLNNTYSVYSNSAESVQNSTNSFNKIFYDEFINASSSSAEVSPKAQDFNKRPVLKDFESYLNERKEFLFDLNAKDTQENFQSNERDHEEIVFAQTNANQETNDGNKNNLETDFLDFGNEKAFTFDSDDNMTENYDATDMDF
ncbi:hypothetical protein DOY81_001053, partial [Sarcophaga bullata]